MLLESKLLNLLREKTLDKHKDKDKIRIRKVLRLPLPNTTYVLCSYVGNERTAVLHTVLDGGAYISTSYVGKDPTI